MKDKFLKLFEYLATIRPRRDELEEQLAEQETWLKKYEKYEGDFQAEVSHARARIAEIEAKRNGLNSEIFEKLMTAGQELAGLLDEAMNQPIDFSDPELKDALAAISVGSLDYKRASDLAYRFRGNQPVLHYLKDVFAAKEISSNIDALTYDPGKVETTINDQAWHVALRAGAPESVQSFLGKVAAHYGVELPDVDMNAVFDDAMQRGMQDATRRTGIPMSSE